MLTIQDTIKEVDGPRIARTLDRTRLVAAQTPQVFRAHSLRRAHAEIDRMRPTMLPWSKRSAVS